MQHPLNISTWVQGAFWLSSPKFSPLPQLLTWQFGWWVCQEAQLRGVSVTHHPAGLKLTQGPGLAPKLLSPFNTLRFLPLFRKPKTQRA